MKSRLFLKFLLLLLVTSLSVVVMMVITMQFFVYRNFSDYVVQQELDSLDGLVEALLVEFQKESTWNSFSKDPQNWHAMLSAYFPGSEPYHPTPPEYFPVKRASDNSGQIESSPGMRPRPENPHKNDLERGPERRGGHGPPGLRPRLPEFSEMARRISLFDANKHVLFGNPKIPEQSFLSINRGGQVVGWVGLVKETHVMSPTDISFLKRQSRAFYMIGAIVLLMAFVVSVIFSRHLTSPVRKIAEGANAIRNRRFDKRIRVTSNDELGQLAEDFNVMAQTLQSHESTRRQWLSDIAHELRTPLAVLRGEIEALQDGIREINSYTIDSLHAEVIALSKIVNDLSLIAKTESGIIEMQHTPVDPVRVLEDVLQRFKLRFDDSQMEICKDMRNTDSVNTMGDADKLVQVFTNIFENIFRYASSSKILTIVTEAAKDYLRISIEDTGPGVSEESLNKLFDRLYRTDRARSREMGGSGLGLSICKSIIVAHQGKIWAENSETGGLRIVIQLPLCR